MVTTLQFEQCLVSKLHHSFLWITSLRVAQVLLQNPLWPDDQERIQEAFALLCLEYFQGKDHQMVPNLLDSPYSVNLKIFRLVFFRLILDFL